MRPFSSVSYSEGRAKASARRSKYGWLELFVRLVVFTRINLLQHTILNSSYRSAPEYCYYFCLLPSFHKLLVIDAHHFKLVCAADRVCGTPRIPVCTGAWVTRAGRAYGLTSLSLQLFLAYPSVSHRLILARRISVFAQCRLTSFASDVG